jgi:hypothetical protein
LASGGGTENAAAQSMPAASRNIKDARGPDCLPRAGAWGDVGNNLVTDPGNRVTGLSACMQSTAFEEPHGTP